MVLCRPIHQSDSPYLVLDAHQLRPDEPVCATLLLIVVVWWRSSPKTSAILTLSSWWQQMDWLLIGIFIAMSLLIMAGADLRADALIILVGTFGGLAIESWARKLNCGRTLRWSDRRCGSFLRGPLPASRLTA